jgi:hypothetical protein
LVPFSEDVKKVLDSLPYYVLLVDSDHHIHFANAAVLHELQMDPENIVGEYCPSLVHGADGPIPECPLEEAARCNRSIEKEFFDDSSNMWFFSTAYKTDLTSGNGKSIFLHFSRDITKFKALEDEHDTRLEELEQWYKLSVGRENKMIDLKKEINSLRVEMGKDEKYSW